MRQFTERGPQLTFANGGIVIRNRSELIGIMPYDARLRALSAYGKRLHEKLFLFGSPARTKRTALAHNVSLPALPHADWRVHGRGLRAFNAGREIWIQNWKPWWAACDIWSGQEALCFGGYEEVWFDDRYSALAVADLFARGVTVPPFHWRGECPALNATVMQIGAKLLDDGHGRRNALGYTRS